MFGSPASTMHITRFIFNVGQYLRLRDTPQARLQQVFIINFQDKLYAFVVADKLRVVIGRQVIRGVPAIANVDWLFFIPAPTMGPWRDLEHDEVEYLLCCQWNLDCQ